MATKIRRWDKLKTRLGPFVDMTNRDKVDEARKEFGVLGLEGLKSEFVRKRKEKSELQETLSDIDVDLKALGGLLIEHLDALGLRSISTDEGHTIGTFVEPQITVEDQESFFNWVDAQPGLQYSWTIAPGTRETMVKEILDRGDDSQLPPGLKVTLRTAVQFTKAK